MTTELYQEQGTSSSNVKHDLVIRVGGEAGEGVISTGELVTQAAARAGYEIMTFKTYPAEIKGGHAVYQLRLSDRQLYSEGDDLDVLIAFNREAYDKHYAELKEGGLMLYDSGDFTPDGDDARTHLAVPLSEIARTQLKFELGKNVVAVGVIAALFGLPKEYLVKLINEKFLRKGEDVVKKNLAALNAGMGYVEEHLPNREAYKIQPGAKKGDVIIVSGNTSLSLGAITGGCRGMFGYPITPASEVLEFMAAELPKLGGVAVQAEDEIASIGMVIGSSYTGVKSMTSSSGPGISLMTELLGYASMAEIPLVVVNVQRAGPSTGMPTKHEQGDLWQAIFSGHGETQRIVIAPTSVEDCFYRAVDAFNLSERYQVPCMLMSDTALATRTESINKPDPSSVTVVSRDLFEANGDHPENYKRFALTESGVSPMSLPGMAGGQYVSTGLEHSEFGRPRYDPKSHIEQTDKRFRKMETLLHDPLVPEAARCGDPTSDIGVITWGSTFGTVAEAFQQAHEQGLSFEGLAPRLLWPLPTPQLDEFMNGKRVIIVPEVNYSGQFAELLKARYQRPIIKLNTYGGLGFKAAAIVKAVREAGIK